MWVYKIKFTGVQEHHATFWSKGHLGEACVLQWGVHNLHSCSEVLTNTGIILLGSQSADTWHSVLAWSAVVMYSNDFPCFTQHCHTFCSCLYIPNAQHHLTKLLYCELHMVLLQAITWILRRWVCHAGSEDLKAVLLNVQVFLNVAVSGWPVLTPVTKHNKTEELNLWVLS